MHRARLKSWRMILVAAVTVATLVHPLLLQLHEQTEHDCGHDHAVAVVAGHHALSDVTHDHGDSDRADHLGHHSHHSLAFDSGCDAAPHGHSEPVASCSHTGLHAGDDAGHESDHVADSALETSSPSEDVANDGPAEEGDTHDHHCFHCVLCYAAAHTGLSEAAVSLSVCTIDSGDAPESRTLDPLTASANPGSPRAPPISPLERPLS